MKLVFKVNFIIAFFLLLLSSNYSQSKTPAYMLSSLDGNTSKTYITRTQSLLDQLSSKYKISETEVGDNVVFLCNNLLRDKYGINQKIQFTMESVNRVQMSSPRKDEFKKLLVVYGVMRNSGQSSNEAINRLNSALQLDRNALDIFLNQK